MVKKDVVPITALKDSYKGKQGRWDESADNAKKQSRKIIFRTKRGYG